MPTNYKIPAEIQIDFFLDGKRQAQRYGNHVPVIGDEVRFNNAVYKIKHRIWVYDEEHPRVALTMIKVKEIK